MKIIYCDHAATTPVKPEVLKSMIPYFINEFGNPSAIYSIGRNTKIAINNARRKVADAINAKTNEIYFTSGGSESDNLAIKGFCIANEKKGKHIITSKIEHPAILNTCESLKKNGYKITYLNVDENGLVNIEELISSICSDTILISIMTANNEIGTIQPIEEIGKIAKERKIAFHTDAVQAIGNIKIDVNKMNIDMLSMSAHKFYGPKGVGALFVRKGINFSEIQDGGHQENNKRAGTENVAGIVGLGKAIELSDKKLKDYNEKLSILRMEFIKQLENKFVKEKIKINGDIVKRLPGNVNVSFKNEDNNKLLIELDKAGICASGGSACASGINSPSHVLLSIGLKREWLEGTVRFTFGEENLISDIEKIIKILMDIIK